MQKICTQCEIPFEITGDDLSFYERISPAFAKHSCAVPPPSQCPDCRRQRRLAWRNESSYFHRSCDLCKKKIVSVHTTDAPYPVYCHTCWWSDNWDPLQYGRRYNPARPFLEQFFELQKEVPQLAMMNDNGVQSENCEYCQDFAFGKNCYLVTGSWRAEDALYSDTVCYVRDISDCRFVNIESELVYESIDSQQLYDSSFLQNCANCQSCRFGFDLRGCSDCLGCVGLRQKRFHIWNVPYSEEEYRERAKDFDLSSRGKIKELRAAFDGFLAKFPRRAVYQLNCEESVGNNLFNCRHVSGFDVFNGEHCKFYVRGDSPKNCYDIQQSGNPQWCYECITPDDSYQVLFSTWCWKSKFLNYCDNCHSAENLFGCIALKRAKNCILNLQYSPEEFEQLGLEIAQRMQSDKTWGEFFPMESSPFSYDSTIAQSHFPLRQEEILARGLTLHEKKVRPPSPPTAQLPDRISETPDSITNEILSCSECDRNYRILPLELTFYRKMNIAPPDHCPECRRNDRSLRAAPHHLWERTCASCKKPVQTVYGPESGISVLCEPCFLETM